MSLYPNPTEKDIDFKTYLSEYKRAVRSIDTSTTNNTLNSQMRLIVEKFPNFIYTNNRVMAIAVHLLMINEKTFDKVRASMLINQVFSSYKTAKDKKNIIIDVYNYWTRLSTIQ